MKKFYITTPIYYPSANLHIGHAYCTVCTDTLARYNRLKGADTFFLTGSDEHGEKIQTNANLKGVTPQAFVDEIVKGFKELWSTLGISNDKYIRTTDKEHMELVQKVFSKLLKQGDIYKGEYKGWYCTPCESFWTNSQVKEGNLCPDCGRPVHEASEEAYFFKVSKYVPELLKFYDEHPNFITPKSRLNEMINTFIKPGLEDLCITRTSFNWGVPVKEDPKHVVYVWIDALLNYISALGYDSNEHELFDKFWGKDTEIVHILGNDISRFHAIYWPIILMSLGLRLPDRLFITGLILTKDGTKMSKSKGNVLSPYPLIERYGVDTLRYYLVTEMVFGQDGSFSPEQFVERINADLVNNYGNLVSRSISMVVKYFNGDVPSYVSNISNNTSELIDYGKQCINDYVDAFDDLRITDAIKSVMNYLDKANKYIELQAPWVLSKDETMKDELASTLNTLINVLRQTTIMLSPVLINSLGIVFKQLGFKGDEDLLKFDSLLQFDTIKSLHVEKIGVLFPRLDKTIEVEAIKNMMK